MTGIMEQYRSRYERSLVPTAEKLESYLHALFADQKNVDRISVRAKSPDSFYEKSQRTHEGQPKYGDPLEEIQDQVGARIVVFYRSDVEPTSEFVSRYFNHIESQLVSPEDEWKFGYFGKHLILITPPDVQPTGVEEALVPQVFELQIKTLFQHAWSQSNHALGYKPSKPLQPLEERKLAFTAAQAWGADQIFDELRNNSIAETESTD